MAYYRQPAISGPGLSSSPGSGFHYNSPFGDTTFTKVFVGGLAWETQSETLRQYFEQFGDILEGVVITDKNTGRSKGYGFVTFRDHDSAKRACADPTPIIDGRRANCNLASLGRPYPAIPFGHLSRSPVPYVGGLPAARGAYFGGLGYQNPLSYMYQQGLPYASYGYPAYNSDYVYPQGVYNPYGGQQYVPMYGAPGTINTAMYPYSQPGQSVRANPGYAAMQILQSANPVTNSSVPLIQAPYPSGVPPHTQLIAPRPPQFPRVTGTDQNAV